MQTSQQLHFFINLSFVHSKIARAFDTGLGNGIGFTDFIILYHLNNAEQGRMRRIDLAEKVSLSPSGVTRLLLPMEKIGLVARESDARDGRVSYVKIAPGGKRLLEESMERAILITESLLPNTSLRDAKEINDIFKFFNIPPHSFC